MRRTLTVVITSAALVAGMTVIPGGPTASANANVTDFSQCSNDPSPSTATDCPGGWINGTLQNTNSHYGEDQVVPQRLAVTTTDTSDHTAQFSYQALKNGIHAYDYLATWNITQFTALPCQGITASWCSTAPSTFPMTSDTNSVPPATDGASPVVSTHELPASSRQWTVYNGAITSSSSITYSGDDAQVTVHFHATAAGTPIIILFGGHLAVSGPATGVNAIPRAWGNGIGASFVSGGPYHIKLSLDGGGGPANNIQAGALVQGTPLFSITKSASTTSTTPGAPVTYTITVTNTGTAPGSVSFVDNYDDRLTPTTPLSTPSGGTCVAGNNSGDLFWTCGTIELGAHGGSQTFTYSANMPTSFTSGAGTQGCATNAYPVVNTATLATGGNPATVVVCVAATAAFTINKVADPTTANPGDTVTYTITVTNTGSASGSTTFTDDYDNRLTPTVPTGCNASGGVLSCTTNSIDPGQQQVFTYTVLIPDQFSGDPGTGCGTGQFALVNTAALPTTGTGSSSSQTVCVNAKPAFTIKKTVLTAGPYTPGETITYQITVTNGGHAAGSTAFTDDYDDRLTPSTVTSTPSGGTCTPMTIGTNKVLQCTTSSIAGGGNTQVFTYTAQLPSLFSGNPGTDCAPGQFEIKNSATLLNGTTDSAIVCVTAAPDFTISKSADPKTTSAGQPVTYTITVTNNGTAAGSTTFTDDYDDRLTVTPPAGCLLTTVGSNKEMTCTTGTIAGGGATQVFMYTVNMPATFDGGSGTGGCNPGSYPVSNMVLLANGRNDGSTVCVSAAPTFTIVKTAVPASAGPGDPVTYTITVSNGGTASGSTTFTDDYDDRLSPSTPVPSPATGPGCTFDTVAGNKVLDCTTGSIVAGSSQTFTYTANMPLTFTDPGTGCPAGQYAVNNTATLANGKSDPATVCVTAAPAFTLTKSADPMTANPNQPVTYTITVTNGGNASGSTTFTDDFDNRLSPGPVTITGGSTAGSCNIVTISLTNKVLQCSTGTIVAGDSQVFQYTANMPATFTGLSPTAGCPSGEYSVKNTATLTGANSDATPHSVIVCVNASPTFTISKSVNPGSIDAGLSVQYTITVTNGGTADGSTTFTDDYDDRLTPSAVTISGTGGSCTPATIGTNKILQCTTGTIAAAGGTQTFMYTAQMPSSFTGAPGGSGCNAVNPQQYPVNNTVTLANGKSDSATECVNAAPLFAITKTFEPNSVSAGDTVTYHVTVTNNGTAAGSTGFVDDYDDRLTPSAVTSTGTGSCIATLVGTNKVLDCTTGTINGLGGTETFTYMAKMPPSFTGPSGQDQCGPGTYPVTNSATLDSGVTTSKTVCVNAAPMFTIDKVATPANVSVGDPVTYVVTVRNTGTASGSTTFTDDYDDRLSPSTPLADPAGGPGCTFDTVAGNKVLDCTTGTINAGDTQTFTYTATMPTSFTGPSGGSGCDPGSFPVSNTATLTTVSTGSKGSTVCVSAAPAFMLSKSVDPMTASPGDNVTYTVTITNTGTAPGSTSFTDDYDDRLNPSVPAGCSLGTIGTNKVLNCTTGSIDPGHQQVFIYSAKLPSTFSGDPGTGCQPGQYAVSNTATLVGVAGSAKNATVCVNASALFTIKKTVLTTGPITPGEPVTYQITVSNGGTASGSTTFTDDYDDRLSPTVPAGCTLATVGTNKVMNCTTGTILAGDSQVFTYTANMPSTFTGDPGGATCTPSNPQQYPVQNTATLANGTSDSATVCVNASPSFTITKTANPSETTAGGLVQYTITVTNGGTASGSTTFTDDFDDRLSPSSVTISGTGGSCSVTTSGNKEINCSTGTILAGQSQTFRYTATMPPTFSGPAGGAGCLAHNPQQYPVTNSVVLANGMNQAATVCVDAAPVAHVVKSVVKSVDTSGDELLTYTIAYSNTGTADAATTLITDGVPTGTTYVSCTGGCVANGSPTVTGVSWDLGPTPALNGSGSVTMTVLVSATAICNIDNTAFLTFDDNAPVASNTVTVTIDPVANPGGAHARGSAIGVQVKATGVVGIGLGPIGTVSTSRSGLGPVSVANKSVLGISLPANGSLVRVPVINETSVSGVEANPPFAQDITSAAVDHVCLLPIANICTVQADTVQAVASTLATGQWSTYSTGGSTIQNLKILGLGTPVNANTTTTIKLNPLVFGAGSYVAIMERNGSAGLVGSTYQADLTVTAIHLVVTGLLTIQSLNVIVSQATSHADFPKTLQCGNVPHQSVSGHAFVAQLLNDPTIADTTVGYVAIPPSGANEEQALASVNLPANDSILGASVADSRSFSNFTATQSYSESSAEIGGNVGPAACVARISPTTCLVTAQVVHSQSQSLATAAGATSTDAGTKLLNVSVLGIPVGLSVPPNTAIIIPGFGYVVLNEQFCDGGGLTFTHKCTGTHHSGLTVRAVDLVFTFLGSGLGVVPATEVIVGEAHSDATFGGRSTRSVRLAVHKEDLGTARDPEGTGTMTGCQPPSGPRSPDSSGSRSARS